MAGPLRRAGTRPHYRVGRFLVRDARAEDRDEVLAFTAHTWEFGDYIQYVFDDWLADRSGRLLVAVDEETGAIAAIDKLTLLSPGEAWFEGLRVNPEFRGQGLASGLQKYLIAEARRLGATKARFLTLLANEPVHRAAYHDGFSRVLTVRFAKWVRQVSETRESSKAEEAYDLRQATPGEALALFEWWQRSSGALWHGLVHQNWSFRQTNADDWQERAVRGQVFVQAGTEIAGAALPPPAVLVSENDDAEGRTWVISTVIAAGKQFGPVLGGLVKQATNSEVSEINGLLPDSTQVLRGLTTAGFDTDTDQHLLCVFELPLE